MNLNFRVYAPSTFEHPHIRANVRFEHGPPKRPPTPIELMMSNTARDSLGFPTYRDIIDVEFEMEAEQKDV